MIDPKVIALTSTPVVRQIIERIAIARKNNPPKRILDPSAGEGVFGMVCREFWPEADITGIEPRDDLWPAPQYYDMWWRRTFEECGAGIGQYDLICTNPPFPLCLAWVKRIFDEGMLTAGGELLFLQLNELGQRGQANNELWLQYPPIFQSRISGAINFKGKGTGKKSTSDMRNYSWWLWRNAPRRSPGWACIDLPRLPSSDRTWVVPPGTETDAPDTDA